MTKKPGAGGGDNGPMSGNRPLVVLTEERRIEAIGSIDAKGFRKSLEHDTLWWIHPETGRLLPYAEARLEALEDRGEWVEAVVTVAEERAASEQPAAGRDEAAPPPVERPRARGATPPHAAGADATDQVEQPSSRRWGGAGEETVLAELADVVHRRRLERPEGSYTTYLFEQGNDKIRKKTGEEAIELVLARRRVEIICEAADLIYHLLVLLEVEEIPLAELLAELSRRRS